MIHYLLRIKSVDNITQSIKKRSVDSCKMHRRFYFIDDVAHKER